MAIIHGSWYLLSDIDRNELIQCGSTISPSAMLHPTVSLCSPVHISPNVQIKNNVSIDKYTFINWNSVIYPNVYIGAYCSIGRGIQIGLANHPVNWLSTHTFQYNANWFNNIPEYQKLKRSKHHIHHPKVSIGSDVWIGNNAMIKAGVTIGHGAVVGAGAIVTKNIPPYAIVGGNPAKIIRYRFDKNTIDKLLLLKWWSLDISQLNGIDFSNIDNAIEQIMKIKDLS
ncbi:CatB-related O-acetyltransferase [Stenoxybacter acetivorans]|uniref:CatB-related O-acetyltransferase n=1 Tax=Stenoxybacter acetivorans TaxID=422441 RepID=UPI0009FD8DC6|nr:CatB-related O-acetyltransferase [Stenoxybacter acetivorans]